MRAPSVSSKPCFRFAQTACLPALRLEGRAISLRSKDGSLRSRWYSLRSPPAFRRCAWKGWPRTGGPLSPHFVQAKDDPGRRSLGVATGPTATIDSVRLLLRDLNSYSQPKGGQGDGVTLDSLRLLIQQSNCLVTVERGLSERDSDDEKSRTRGPNSQVRADANMGAGQEVAADFVLRGKALSVNANESRNGFNLGAFIPFKALGNLSAGQSTSSADVQLVLYDVRSKVQLAVAQGHGAATDTGLATNLLSRVGGGLGAGQFKSDSKTSPSKILLEAYADAYNKLVTAIRIYKTQTVKGGLGTGGTLKVQGSRTDSPKK